MKSSVEKSDKHEMWFRPQGTDRLAEETEQMLVKVMHWADHEKAERKENDRERTVAGSLKDRRPPQRMVGLYGALEESWDLVKQTGYSRAEVFCLQNQDAALTCLWPTCDAMKRHLRVECRR